MIKIIEEGKLAPDFTLKNQKNEEVKLSSFRGKNVILAFFPFDFSPVCSDEMNCFQKDLEKFNDKNTTIFGISVDSVWSHKAFAEKLNLNYNLLSDFDKAVCLKYRTLNEDGYSVRAYFIIDKNGIIKFRKLVNPGEKLNNNELLKALNELK